MSRDTMHHFGKKMLGKLPYIRFRKKSQELSNSIWLRALNVTLQGQKPCSMGKDEYINNNLYLRANFYHAPLRCF